MVIALYGRQEVSSAKEYESYDGYHIIALNKLVCISWLPYHTTGVCEDYDYLRLLVFTKLAFWSI